MARVEKVRQLEFKQPVRVDVISRAEYQQRVNSTFSDLSKRERIRKNIKWKALMVVNETTNAVSVQQRNSGASATAFYSSTQDKIILIGEENESVQIDESLLGHELVHALQNQHFSVVSRYNLSTFEQRHTTEKQNSFNGLIEGDALVVEREYEQRCGDEWTCYIPDSPDQGTPNINYGMYLVNYQPYSDGPGFVRTIRRDSGWAGVNRLYENPPASTRQVARPELYGQSPPKSISISDSSTSEWNRLRMDNGQPDFVSVGQPGIAVMLFNPFYQSGRQSEPIIGTATFINTTEGSNISSVDPVNYESSKYADGWNGSKMALYYKSNRTSQEVATGYVWKINWETPNDAQEFTKGYKELLKYHGASAQKDRVNTYVVPSGKDFSGAYYFKTKGSTVTIVYAPSVEELKQVDSSAAPKTMRSRALEYLPYTLGALCVLTLLMGLAWRKR